MYYLPILTDGANMTAHQNIIQNVKRRLEVVGLTPSEAAKRAGLATTTVTRPLNDANHLFTLSTSTLQALCGPLQCRIEDLVGEPALSLGAKLRNARIAKDMKQHEVAAALDVTVQAVSQWERDENSPTGINLLKLRALLGVEIFPESLLELRMGARPKFESEADRITAHETEMQELCVNTPSQIADAINLHKMLVAADERLYLDDGTPLANKAVLNTSWVREIRAFRILARMQCTTADEAQIKLAYFMKPAPAGDEYSNMEKLWLDAYVDESDKGTGSSDLHMDFMRSLVVTGAK